MRSKKLVVAAMGDQRQRRAYLSWRPGSLSSWLRQPLGMSLVPKSQ